MSERPWVLQAAGRAERLQTPLDCTRCDRSEIPDGYVETRRSPVFSQATIPAGLRSRHRTKPGVWARLLVRSGRLRYRQHLPVATEQILVAGEAGVILPEVEHEVEPIDAVEFEIAFLGAPPATPDSSESDPLA